MTREPGFTLIEVLIAMSIVGVIFVLILHWQTSTLQVSTRSNVLAEQLSELNDVTGYVGDRVRAAEAVRLTGFTVNGDPCGGTTPCLAVLTLTEDVSASGGVTRTWHRLVFRVEPRPGWTGADKLDDAWADDASNKVVVLREYRDTCKEKASDPTHCEVSGTLSVSAFKAGLFHANLGGMNPQLVGDHLTSVDGGGAAIVPFAAQNPSKAVAPGNPVVLAFQSKRHVRGVTTFVPATAPLSLTVQPRNVAP